MYAFLIFAIVVGCRGANVNKHMKLLSELDNYIEPNLIPLRGPRRFVTIKSAPPALSVHQPGTAVSLTCEALGTPAPSIHWFKNNKPIFELETNTGTLLSTQRILDSSGDLTHHQEHNTTCLQQVVYNQESNEIFDSNPSSIAQLSSTLLIARTDGRDEYTCVAVAGSKTARVHSVVHSVDGSTDLITDRARLVPLAPQILVTYKFLMDLIGSNVVLPCHVRGHPRPKVTWKNNRGATVKDPRMKVLRSGELVITPLLWSDMGDFTCHVTNAFGSQQAITFLYPISLNKGRVNKIKQ